VLHRTHRTHRTARKENTIDKDSQDCTKRKHHCRSHNTNQCRIIASPIILKPDKGKPETDTGDTYR